MSPVTVEQVTTEPLARLKVFETPNSVFTEEDNLQVCACFVREENLIYALVSSLNFSLLYRIDGGAKPKENRAVTFE